MNVQSLNASVILINCFIFNDLVYCKDVIHQAELYLNIVQRILGPNDEKGEYSV
jgi:hypothetical protein